MAPCKDCTKRHLLCHADCADYKKFKEENEEIKKRKYQYNDPRNITIDRKVYYEKRKYNRYK